MFLQNLRAKVGARLNGDKEAGFTLIELLVVMLILGILAAIALPAFFNQKEKAGDAKAKEVLHSAQVAMETCNTEKNGTYDGCDAAALNDIEPTIPAALPASEAAAKPGQLFTVTASGNTYTLAAKGNSGWFKIVNTGGSLAFSCGAPDEGGCGPEGSTEGEGTWGE